MIITEGINTLDVQLEQFLKTWLNWHDELVVFLTPGQPATDRIKSLYNRMLADPSLAIPGMTQEEQNLLNGNIYDYLVRIGANPSSIPSDLTGKLMLFTFTPDLINFVYNGRNV